VNTLEAFNTLDRAQATTQVLHWCAAPNWATEIAANRPYPSLAALQRTTTQLWSNATESDLLAAFAAHPVIGDIELLRSKYAPQANEEQGQVLQAREETIAELAKQNLAYRERHGFTFIVFATGKSAEQMLDLLKGRIHNATSDEMDNAAAEQLKIMQLRIEQSFMPTPGAQ